MEQQEFWNNKFLRDGFLYGLNPNEFIVSQEEKFDKSKTLLCLGEGEGRNAIYFAKEGFEVLALDASNIGLEKLEKRAKENNLNIQTQCLDLTLWQNSKKYGTILASYLHLYEKDREEFFKKVEDALDEKGLFVAEFFSTEQIAYESGGPKDLELLYKLSDFETIFSNSKVLLLEQKEVVLNEGKGHQGLANVIRLVIQKKSL